MRYILKVSNQHKDQLFSFRLYFNAVHWCSSQAVYIHVHDLIGKYSHKVHSESQSSLNNHDHCFSKIA